MKHTIFNYWIHYVTKTSSQPWDYNDYIKKININKLILFAHVFQNETLDWECESLFTLISFIYFLITYLLILRHNNFYKKNILYYFSCRLFKIINIWRYLTIIIFIADANYVERIKLIIFNTIGLYLFKKYKLAFRNTNYYYTLCWYLKILI